MTTDRRSFIAAGLGAATVALPACARNAAGMASAKPGKPLRILVLGGTGFLGPHFVAAARAKGHKLTLFNRGRSNPMRFSGEAFKDVEQLRGDRKSDMTALEGGRRWDAVLDTSAYIPADVTRSAKLLSPRVGQYLIVSTISVYAEIDKPGQDETAPLAQLTDPTATEITGETYGGLKALCEQAAEAEMPGRVTVVRPGRISTLRARAIGLRHRPLETTVADTLTYWRELPEERRAKPKAGITPAREAEVLKAWHARNPAGG
jgi:2'-hydroxyisoflavone reductase